MFFLLQAFACLSDKLEPLVEGVRTNKKHWIDLAQSSEAKFVNNNNDATSHNNNNQSSSNGCEKSSENKRPTLGSPTSKIESSKEAESQGTDSDNHSIGSHDINSTSNFADKIVGRLGVDLTTTSPFTEVPSYLMTKKENGWVHHGPDKIRLLRLTSLDDKPALGEQPILDQ